MYITQPPVSNAAPDNNATAAASSAPASVPAGFRFVLSRTANGAYARKRYNQLKTYGTKVYIDSVRSDTTSLYKIYLVKDAAPSDTARLRDSLTKYYGKPVRVEAGQ